MLPSSFICNNKKGADDKILCICKSLKAIFSRWTTNNCYIMAVYEGIISVNELELLIKNIALLLVFKDVWKVLTLALLEEFGTHLSGACWNQAWRCICESHSL